MLDTADTKLARRILAGDQRSFDVFFNTYYPRMFRFALTRLDQDRDLADETAQVVLCQALSKLGTYRGEAPLFSWLCTFCRHEVSKQRQSRRRAQGDTELTEDDPAVMAALDSLLNSASNDPATSAYQAEVRRLVKVTLDYLPALYADALEAKYVNDLSVNEIATLIGKSPKATESVLTRARDAFRDSFQSLLDKQPANDGSQSITSLLEY